MERTERRPLSPALSAALVAGMGAINLLSAVTPGLPSRVAWLQRLFPVEIRHSAHLFAALSGFWLLILASGLWRRKRVAWLLTLVMLTGSIVFNLVKGWDVEESLLALAVLLLLVATRRAYTARSDPPSMAQGARALLAAGLFTLAYGTAGFLLMDRAFGARFDLPGAAWQTLVMLLTQDTTGLVATTPFSRFFVPSVGLVGDITLIYALWMLLRPILLRGDPASEAQRLHAQAIVRAHGHGSLATLTLLPDKAYVFSGSGQSVIAYVPKGRGAVALGDPIGPREEAAAVIREFQEVCRRNDWTPAFYQTQPELLELYESLGFRALKIGEEAIVDLKQFSTSGKAGQDLRAARNKLGKLGHHISFHQPPLDAALMAELRLVSEDWLRMKKGSEKRFSVGWFEEAYVRDSEVVVIRSPEGMLVAFANLLSTTNLRELTIDMMRHRADMPHGTMDFLFTALLEEGQRRGFEQFSLGLSALSGVGEGTRSGRMEQAIHYLYEHLNQFYNFKGLHAYKEKFHPRWEPRYLLFPSYGALMDIVVALIRADSGDRLIDYFKPEL
ncbi:MAG: phosphatidylglycerol lysyltransferase domain-containing protein [Cyanobacteriota bacterium]